MKPTDFAKQLTSFFSEYLPGTRNLSANTIMAYRDTFRLLLMFCHDFCKISTEKLSIKMLDDNLVIRFLDWIQEERHCSIATRNQRLASIHAFFGTFRHRTRNTCLGVKKSCKYHFRSTKNRLSSTLHQSRHSFCFQHQIQKQYLDVGT